MLTVCPTKFSAHRLCSPRAYCCWASVWNDKKCCWWNFAISVEYRNSLMLCGCRKEFYNVMRKRANEKETINWIMNNDFVEKESLAPTWWWAMMTRRSFRTLESRRCAVQLLNDLNSRNFPKTSASGIRFAEHHRWLGRFLVFSEIFCMAPENLNDDNQWLMKNIRVYQTPSWVTNTFVEHGKWCILILIEQVWQSFWSR